MTTGFTKDRIGSYIEKDPDALLDYTLDWNDWFGCSDGLNTSSWEIEIIENDNTPITSSTHTADTTSNTTTVWLSGGTVGNHYRITNTITTTNNLTEERYFRIFIMDRSA